MSRAGIDVSAHGFPATAAEARRVAEEIGAPTEITSQVLSGGPSALARVVRALRPGRVLAVQRGGRGDLDHGDGRAGRCSSPARRCSPRLRSPQSF